MTKQKKNDRQAPAVSRRETLKLASAVGALGVGLGVTLDGKDADAAQLSAAAVGQLTIKFFKMSKDAGAQLVHAFDLGAVSHKAAKDVAGQYTIKLYNIKVDKTDMVAEQSIELAAPTLVAK